MEPREPRESSEGRERRLDEILAAYFQAKAAGQAPNRDLWISQYPEYATDLAEFFADQERFQVLANPLRRATHSTQGRSLTACEIPEPTEPDSSHFDDPSHATRHRINPSRLPSTQRCRRTNRFRLPTIRRTWPRPSNPPKATTACCSAAPKSATSATTS